MKQNNWLTCSVVFSSIFISVDLDAGMGRDAQLRNFEYRLSTLESSEDPCRITPPARPTQKCDFGAYITVDPLFLKPQENGLEFVAKTQNNGQINIPNFALQNFISGKTSLKSPQFQWDWGFRLGLGLNLPHDGWEVFASWTRFFSDAHKHVTAAPNTFLTPMLLNAQGADNELANPPIITPGFTNQGLLTEARSHWRLHLNEVDLELAREFFVSKWLILKPHTGLKTAWIRQKSNNVFENFLNISDFFPTITGVSQSMSCNYWGIGLMGGLDTQWGLACGWSFFANFAASILYGYFQVAASESDTGFYLFPPDTIPFANDLFNAHDFYHVNRFITDFIAGISYDYMFCDERYHLGFQAGWELHIFFGQNQFFKFYGAPAFPAEMIANQGDLTLQGLSAQVRFDF